jgi:adenylosuccinate lyase
MPHKRNPVGCENVSGLARLVRSYVQAALEDIPLWHERDISHSSVERVVFPDATTLVDYMLDRMTGILDGLIVYPERMQQNMDRMKGLVFSQAVLLTLASKGLSREAAYDIVQRNAMMVWEGKGTFRELLEKDAELSAVLPAQELAACFDATRTLRHVDAIYARAFPAD